MNRIALDTLGLFLKEHPDFFGSTGSVFFPRAIPHAALFPLRDRIVAHQSCKVSHSKLAALGFSLIDQPPLSASSALVIPTRQKKESLFWMARSLQMLPPGGVLLVCSEIQQGGKSYRKALSELCGESESWSKNHCVIAWAKKDPSRVNFALIEELVKEGEQRSLPELPLTTQIGIYGWDKVDVGSQLLCESIPEPLTGHGADFGSGYGYLSWYILTHHPKVQSLTLFESEGLALMCARKNLSSFSGTRKIEYRWADVITESTKEEFDWIVMNPPHHDDQGLDFELGRAFVRAAGRALKREGTLYMVANEHLTYEKILKESFDSFHEVNRKRGFKVLRAP